MTDQRRPASERGTEAPAPGYRGALPPRGDSLARPWVAIVLVIFVLIFALSFMGFPSSILPSPSPFPLPSITPAPSGSESASPSASASQSSTASASESLSASASVAASPSPAP